MGWEEKLAGLEAVLARSGHFTSPVPSFKSPGFTDISSDNKSVKNALSFKDSETTPTNILSASTHGAGFSKEVASSVTLDAVHAGRNFEGATASFSAATQSLPQLVLASSVSAPKTATINLEQHSGSHNVSAAALSSPHAVDEVHQAEAHKSLKSDDALQAPNLPAAVATILASAVSQALGNINAYQQRVLEQSQLLSKLRDLLGPNLPPEVEARIGRLVTEAPAANEHLDLGAAALASSSWGVPASSPSTGGRPVHPSTRGPGSPGHSAALRLGPHAVELLQTAGWGPSGSSIGNNDSGRTFHFPFSPSLVTAVALAHAGHPDRLCAQVGEIGKIAQQLRLETQLLRSVVDQVRSEHARRISAVDNDRLRLLERVRQLEGQLGQGSGRAKYRASPDRLPTRKSPVVFSSPGRVSVDDSASSAQSPSGFPLQGKPTLQSVGFAREPAGQDKARKMKVVATPHIKKGQKNRPASANARIADPSRGTDVLHPVEAASPPVALKRGTGLGAGGGKLLHATSTGAGISAALLRAIGGRAAQPPAFTRGRALTQSTADGSMPAGIPRGIMRHRLTKSMGAPLHTEKTDASVSASRALNGPSTRPLPTAAINAASIAAQRIRQYRNRSKGAGGAVAKRGSRSLGATLAAQRGVGPDMFNSLQTGPALASPPLSSPPWQRPALTERDLAASTAVARQHFLSDKGSSPHASSSMAAITSSASAAAPVPTAAIPPSLVAILDRIHAARRR